MNANLYSILRGGFAGAFRRASEQWPVLSLRSVLESSAFSEAAA